jgi:RNA polymerase sigma-70 factor (ECF subfamily)
MFSWTIAEKFRTLAASDARLSGLQARVSEIYLEARDDVYRYSLTFGLTPGEAQEAAQEVFLRLYTTMRSGTEIENPRAWVFRVAHNLSLQMRAKASHQAPYDPQLELKLAAAEPGAEQRLIDRERNLRLHRAIEGLSEQQRRCVFLRMEGLRYPEIAEALGISASSVGEFLRRAMNRLRKESRE